MSEERPEWLEKKDMRRVKKSDIPTVWDKVEMRRFLRIDDVALMRAADVISEMLGSTDGDTARLAQTIYHAIPTGILGFVTDVNKKYRETGRLSRGQLNSMRRTFMNNGAFIDYLVIYTNERNMDGD